MGPKEGLFFCQHLVILICKMLTILMVPNSEVAVGVKYAQKNVWYIQCILAIYII